MTRYLPDYIDEMTLRISWLTLAALLLGARAEGLRIISTSPQITEVLFQVGKGADVAATSERSDYPPEARSLKTIGPLYMPGLEATVEIKPDWVLLDAGALNVQYEISLVSHHIRTLKLEMSSVTHLLDSTASVLRKVYGESSNSVLDRHRRCLTSLRAQKNFKFLIIAWLSPVVLFGHDTFLSDVLSLLGGRNVAPDKWKVAFPQVADEWVVQNEVDIVYFIEDMPGFSDLTVAFARRWWPRHPPTVKLLKASHFARASFTPLIHLDELTPNSSQVQYRRCLDADG